MAKQKRPGPARSRAAKAGWETRRANQHAAEARAQKRSASAKRGWVVRREKKLLKYGYHPSSARAWAGLDEYHVARLQDLTDKLMGPYGELRGRDRVEYMRNWIDSQKKGAFEKIVADIEAATSYTAGQIRSAFFSPRAVKI